MNTIDKLKIYIVDRDDYTCEKLKKEFEEFDNVEIINEDIRTFYKSKKDEIDCLVSPANAFGRMTGGFDAGLSSILGWDFQLKVQQYIKDNFYGEQVVGSSFIIKTDIEGLSLIHTPTMRYPSSIKDDEIVYHCMRSTLICALQNDIKCIVIPVFGGCCGNVRPDIASKRLKEGYLQILEKSSSICF